MERVSAVLERIVGLEEAKERKTRNGPPPEGRPPAAASKVDEWQELLENDSASLTRQLSDAVVLPYVGLKHGTELLTAGETLRDWITATAAVPSLIHLKAQRDNGQRHWKEVRWHHFQVRTQGRVPRAKWAQELAKGDDQLGDFDKVFVKLNPTAASASSTPSTGSGGKYTAGKCHRCGKAGHKQADCRVSVSGNGKPMTG